MVRVGRVASGRADVAADPGEHLHKLAEPAAWPWLPIQHGGPVAAHPYCTDCGSVKAVGGERALDIGGMVNLLASLYHHMDRAGIKVSEAQRRLILRRLIADEADDTFARARSAQLAVLVDAVGAQTGLSADVVRSYLHVR